MTDRLDRLEASLTKSLAGFLTGLRSTKKPTTGTDMTIPTEVAESLNHLRGIVEFAYQQGFHELGYDPIKCLESALTKAEAVTWSAEDACEAFIAAEIDAAPEALRRLGEWLNQRMDEDDAKTASRMVLGAMMETSAAIRAVASNATGCCDGVCTGSCDGYPSTSNAHAQPAEPVASVPDYKRVCEEIIADWDEIRAKWEQAFPTTKTAPESLEGFGVMPAPNLSGLTIRPTNQEGSAP